MHVYTLMHEGRKAREGARGPARGPAKKGDLSKEKEIVFDRRRSRMGIDFLFPFFFIMSVYFFLSFFSLELMMAGKMFGI